MSVNKVIVIGNLVANPNIRALPSGQNVANFSLATAERFSDRNGAKQERTDWHRIVAFGRVADTCERFLSKGRQVYIEGRLTTRQYEAKRPPTTLTAKALTRRIELPLSWCSQRTALNVS
jgi:single-strand DNA-binding protein